MDSKNLVIKNTNCILNDMVEGELLQVNGGTEYLIPWVVEQLIEKTIELGKEIYKVASKPKEDVPSVPRSHSSGGRTLYDTTPIEVNFEWRA